MTITNLRLLEGIGQALQAIDANSSDAMSKALTHAASIAVDELRKRDNLDTISARYLHGRQLLGTLLDQAGNTELRSAFTALPSAIDASQSWRSAKASTDALLGVAEKICLAQNPGNTTPAVQDALNELLAWEAEGYQFPRPPNTGAVSTAISAESVEQFIRSQSGNYADAKVAAFHPLAGGFSKQTILFDLVTEKQGKESFALRGDGAVKVLGLRGQNISREYHLLRYANAFGILCAEPMWLNDVAERPWFISRQRPGRNIGDGIQSNDDVPDSVAKSLAEEIAKIHLLPIDQSHPDIKQSHLAADGSLTRYEAQKRFIEEWVAVWRKNGLKSPIAASAIQWILDNVPQEKTPATLVHCDCGFNNLLIDDGKVSAVLDWEISHLGDPAEDLGWLMFQIKNKDTQQRFLKYYRDAGGIAQVDPFRLKYYDVLASMKMIIAMIDIGECFQRIPDASVHLCSYAVPYLAGPLGAISQQIQEAEALRS
jgi:aminoglycoside phosphotransferase (APT) family kinase protein